MALDLVHFLAPETGPTIWNEKSCVSCLGVCAVVRCLVACASASAHWEMKHAVPVLQPFSCSRHSQVLCQTPPISDTCLGQLRTRLACSGDAYVVF